ncbi:hypothetical protein Bpfe_015121 [Biomphalaria pfeifferi]|uniref:Uncharacterized protein n=1 Tax=Biomphalaria pfeifferi TaxID=112525 RepID=A0AAD8BIT4_BIOPF|nr:hypothetical protein Bpfe_015121 [Biomphalaria pfeifferi]
MKQSLLFCLGFLVGLQAQEDYTEPTVLLNDEHLTMPIPMPRLSLQSMPSLRPVDLLKKQQSKRDIIRPYHLATKDKPTLVRSVDRKKPTLVLLDDQDKHRLVYSADQDEHSLGFFADQDKPELDRSRQLQLDKQPIPQQY